MGVAEAPTAAMLWKVRPSAMYLRSKFVPTTSPSPAEPKST
jgi:hypothetical protein